MKTETSRPLKIAVFVGGSGTRLWPMSRKASPKQFQHLVGDKTMFQQMIDHLLLGFSVDDIFIFTSRAYVEVVLEQAPMLKAEHVITEPELRDTAAAVGFAAVHIRHKFQDALMATIWGGDHLVRRPQVFIDALRQAQKLAIHEGIPVQVCVRPTFPSTALGYIEIGEPVHSNYGKNIYAYVRQIEKPDLQTAKKFLASINFLWHPGYRIWDISTLLGFYQTYAAESYQALMAIEQALDTPEETAVIETEYSKIIKKSIDYVIYEHLGSEDQAVIAADLGWNDIGTWQVLHDELADSPDETVIQGQALLMDTTGSLIYAPKDKLVAVVGMTDVVVVDTEDALLVIPRERAGDVKKVVEQLKEQGLDQYL